MKRKLPRLDAFTWWLVGFWLGVAAETFRYWLLGVR